MTPVKGECFVRFGAVYEIYALHNGWTWGRRFTDRSVKTAVPTDDLRWDSRKFVWVQKP